MAIQEVPWFQACVEVECLQCLVLLDTPGVKMERKARLNSVRDGYVLIDFECPECHWKPPTITTCLDASAVLAEHQNLIVAPTKEEIAEVQAKPVPRKTSIVQPTRPNVEVDELFAHAEKKFPPSMKLKSGEKLERSIAKIQNADASGIKVTYTDGKGSTIREGDMSKPNPFHVERTLFCEPDLPDNQEMVDWVMAKINANNQWNNPAPRRAPLQAPALNASRSRIKVGCTYPIDDFGNECGDTTGGCGHPGILKNLASPSGMRAATNISVAPDGSPVQSLQQRLAPETVGM